MGKEKDLKPPTNTIFFQNYETRGMTLKGSLQLCSFAYVRAFRSSKTNWLRPEAALASSVVSFKIGPDPGQSG